MVRSAAEASDARGVCAMGDEADRESCRAKAHAHTQKELGYSTQALVQTQGMIKTLITKGIVQSTPEAAFRSAPGRQPLTCSWPRFANTKKETAGRAT